MADKFIKSITFVKGGDTYYHLPKVTNADDGKVLKVVNGAWGLDYLVPPPYLSFIGNEDFTLKTANTTKNWDGTLEYSTDTTTWNTWDGTEISSVGSKLYLRGTGNTKITSYSSDYRFVFTGTNALKIACRGNIENLLDYETVSAGGHPTMAENCYRYMFCDCTALTTAPALPATTLAGYCYRRMFSGCTALTTAPELPATTLAEYCYESMFSGCTALTTAPALPATTLVNYCYAGMFLGCTSLAETPALPETTLANNCYESMFSGCISLTTAPELPATTLAEYCYYSMFSGCTALTTAPELPATTLAEYCYYSMFSNCTKIKLSATQTGEYQTAYRIPKTGTGTTATDALKDMFANTGGTFKGTPEINTTYYLVPPYLTFDGNEDFTLKTANNTKNWDGVLEYSTDAITWNTWNGTEISSAGSKLYLRGTGNTKITGNSRDYRLVFTGTGNLKIACKGNIENLLDYETVSAGGHPTMGTNCYRYMFNGCTSLTTAPALPATKLAGYCYRGMFDGCTSLTAAPALPATTLAVDCYRSMFDGCTALTTAPELPATTLVNYCYSAMFQGCTALTTAPELPATTLAGYCYRRMFNGCTKIKLSTTQTGEYQTVYRIPKSGTGTTATDALKDMFANTGGTFTGAPEINTTYYLSTSNTVV